MTLKIKDIKKSREEYKLRMAFDLLWSYADSEQAEKVVSQMQNNPETTVKDYVMALSDGLLYGNWPWVFNKTVSEILGDKK